MKHGRKFALTVAFLAISTFLMGGSFALALVGKLSADWVSIMNIWLMTGTGAITGFAATNAYVTGKKTPPLTPAP